MITSRYGTGQGQSIENLDPTLLEFLNEKYPKYYKRIKSLGRRKLLAPATWIKGGCH
jgi:hypothetical protein